MERRWQPKISIEFVESKRLRCEIRAANLLRCAWMNWIKWFCTKGSASQFTYTRLRIHLHFNCHTKNLWEWKLKLIIQTNFSRTEVPSKFDISRLILGVCYIHQFLVTLMHSNREFRKNCRWFVLFNIFSLSKYFNSNCINFFFFTGKSSIHRHIFWIERHTNWKTVVQFIICIPSAESQFIRNYLDENPSHKTKCECLSLAVHVIPFYSERFVSRMFVLFNSHPEPNRESNIQRERRKWRTSWRTHRLRVKNFRLWTQRREWGVKSDTKFQVL